MTFRDDMNRINDAVDRRAQLFLVFAIGIIAQSIRDGHELTGAPGQPVDTANLLNSWQERFPEVDVGEVITNVIYAPVIEDLIGRFGPIQIRSEVGGGHSVKLTRAAWQKIADAAMTQARGEAA